jgi:signal transduction histidine kinase
LSALDDSDNTQIRESKLYIVEAIAALRTLTQASNGDFVIKEGLYAAVLKLSNSFNSLKHLTCSFENTIETVIQLNEVNELIVYRCIQEIVNNAVKHSEANEIKIIFWQSACIFKVMITDNGKGFELSNFQSNGMGLMNIAERITLINGELDIQSIINKGTQITLSVPQTK